MDSDASAAQPWIDEAKPAFPVLIDRAHLLSSLYNMVNVPQAVWIDEEGRIVRPTETGGSLDILREFDPSIGGFSEEAQQKAGEVKAAYLEAVKDWARHGADSRYVFDESAARDHVSTMSDDVAMAHTKFRLGFHLQENGDADEAEKIFAECRELHPDSWNIFRQTTEKMDIGIAAGEEFWGKVMSLGDKAYYDRIDMVDIPHQG